MAFDASRDYMADIKKAEAAGDYKTAAVLEKQRNEKISATKSNYAQTNTYQKYLDSANKNSYGYGGSSSGQSSSNSSSVSSVNPYYGVSYDSSKDYQAAIDAAVAGNDFKSAAQYERQRNAKLWGMGQGNQSTNIYADYLNKTPQSSAYAYSQPKTYTVGQTVYNDPYEDIRKGFRKTGGDLGLAFEDAIASGDLNRAIETKNLRYIVNGNKNDDLQFIYGSMIFDAKEKKKQEELLAQQKEEQERLLREQEEAERSAIRAATDNAVSALEAQKSAVNENAAQAGRAAYLEYMKALNRFGAQSEAAAQFGSGGSGDYMKTAALNSFQGAQSSILGQRDKLLNDIASAIIQARNSGNIQEANALADSAARMIANSQWNFGQQQNLSNAKTNAYQAYVNAVSGVRDKLYNRDIYADETAYNRKLAADETAYARAQADYARTQADKNSANAVVSENRSTYNSYFQGWLEYYQNLGMSAEAAADRAAAMAQKAVDGMNRIYPFAY